jgi:hypothetical protein
MHYTCISCSMCCLRPIHALRYRLSAMVLRAGRACARCVHRSSKFSRVLGKRYRFRSLLTSPHAEPRAWSAMIMKLSETRTRHRGLGQPTSSGGLRRRCSTPARSLSLALQIRRQGIIPRRLEARIRSITQRPETCTLPRWGLVWDWAPRSPCRRRRVACTIPLP